MARIKLAAVERVMDNIKRNLALAYPDLSGIEFLALIKRNNIWRFQFHPELSGLDGSKFIKIMIKNLSQQLFSLKYFEQFLRTKRYYVKSRSI